MRVVGTEELKSGKEIFSTREINSLAIRCCKKDTGSERENESEKKTGNYEVGVGIRQFSSTAVVSVTWDAIRCAELRDQRLRCSENRPLDENNGGGLL